MRSGRSARARGGLWLVVAACAIAAGCGRGGGVFAREYEYEEELYLALDGSATLDVNASVASLVALRGAPFDPDPRARVDRTAVRTFFGAPAARVAAVGLARRDGRRFVHARVQVDRVRDLASLGAFAWSSYRLDRRGDVLEFRQTVGAPAGAGERAIRWRGDEIVAFRLHLPSAIVFHNSPSGVIQRGNILEWDQPLSDRLAGAPVDIRVELQPTSILANTLLLFGATIAAAAATLAGVVWWISRRR
ncbi:MAG: hypothetical protein HY824_06095 [Acidobacteria bacterium]|nr:hypothetical protein [Acidobacteriota bacterium]